MFFMKAAGKMKGIQRAILDQMIDERYGIRADYPWGDGDQTAAVYRHAGNRKWFALVIDVPRRCLEPMAEGEITIVNFKCDPTLIGSLRMEKGFYPAYHMNKDRWISVCLDGAVDIDRIAWLLEMSYELTKSNVSKARNENNS